MVRVLQEKKIKSADRVLEILEMFDSTRGSVTVMDVARNLNYPQSSTSELLGSLVRHGYLLRDRIARTYRPTARVALLGAWVRPDLFRDGRLLPLMDELNQGEGEAVVLASVVDVRLRHLHTVGSLPASLRTGTAHHVLHSPPGRTLLCKTPYEYLRKLVHRLNAESEPDQRIRFDDLAADLNAVRSRGFAIGPVDANHSCISVLLPENGDQERLALGLVVATAGLVDRCEGLVRTLKAAVADHLYPARAPASPPRPVYALAS